MNESVGSGEKIANLKLWVARSQLGSATELFQRHKDPISVHVLASSACELLEGVNRLQQLPTFTSHILGSNPTISEQHLNTIRRKYYNSFKHLIDHKGNLRADDVNTISKFSDQQNDAILFQGWYDYFRSAGKLPIAVQIFQLWCYAVYPDWVAPNTDRTIIEGLFGDMSGQTRLQKKRRLARMIDKYRKDKMLLAELQTENRPLMVKAN